MKSGKFYSIIGGIIPVMISVPHVHIHSRNGEKLPGELMIGELAKELHKRVGCHYIIQDDITDYDPNYDKGNEYQDGLFKYIEENGIMFLIDLHGCSENGNDFGIDIGTGGHDMKSFIKNMLPSMNILDMPITYNKRYKASKDDTITKFISNRCSGCRCIQMEISSKLRKKGNSFKELVDFMCQMIKNIDKHYSKKMNKLIRLNENEFYDLISKIIVETISILNIGKQYQLH